MSDRDLPPASAGGSRNHCSTREGRALPDVAAAPELTRTCRVIPPDPRTTATGEPHVLPPAAALCDLGLSRAADPHHRTWPRTCQETKGPRSRNGVEHLPEPRVHNRQPVSSRSGAGAPARTVDSAHRKSRARAQTCDAGHDARWRRGSFGGSCAGPRARRPARVLNELGPSMGGSACG